MRGEVVLRDGGVPFDPFGTPTRGSPLGGGDSIGGLGIMMVKRLMDAHSYRYVDGCNEVTIAKRW
ncbi:MAG: ATP-binding protein [Eggerthellaceae bacterium]